MIYSNAFKLKTEISSQVDGVYSQSTRPDFSIQLVSSELTTIQAKSAQLERSIVELQELGKREIVASKRDVVNGYDG